MILYNVVMKGTKYQDWEDQPFNSLKKARFFKKDLERVDMEDHGVKFEYEIIKIVISKVK